MALKFTSRVFQIGLTVGGHSTMIFDVFLNKTFHTVSNSVELQKSKIY